MTQQVRKTYRPFLPVLVAILLSSCRGTDRPLRYLGDAERAYYKNVATQVDYPVLEEESALRPLNSEPPRRIRHPRKDELWDLELQQVIQIAPIRHDGAR